jgi:hypothetical protein
MLMDFNNLLNIAVLYFIFANCSFCADWSQDVLPNKWNTYARNKLDEILNRKINKKIAKNVVLFIGDGMGIFYIYFSEYKNLKYSIYN